MSKYSPVLVIGDTHTPAMLSEYPQFLLSVYEKYKCRTVIHIGDLLDLHCVSYHERSPDISTSEIDEAIEQISLLSQMFPRLTLLSGNHDSLIQRQAVSAGLPNRVLKPFRECFNLPKSWVVLPRFYKYRLDGVLYMHGDQGKGGQQAALKNAQAEFCSVVQGHYHSQAGIWYHCNESQVVFGMQVGCGVDRKHIQMEYGVKLSAKPVISCGVVIDRHTAFVELMPL